MRPSEENARQAIKNFLCKVDLGGYDFNLIEDGDDGWAFWLYPADTTSYVHADLTIEWLGTTFDEE